METTEENFSHFSSTNPIISSTYCTHLLPFSYIIHISFFIRSLSTVNKWGIIL